MLDFLKNISPKELVALLVVILIVVLFFGGKTVTSLGRASGETFREIKKIKKNFTEALEDDESHKKGEGVSKQK
jgi:Sec-independent protein translocase protein TatA